MSSTMTMEGRIHFFPRIMVIAVMPAAQAVTCPDGKEKPSSAGEPTAIHQSSYSMEFSKGRRRATLSLRITFVISAPQHTAPKMHTPRSRVFANSRNRKASRKKGQPFSPINVIKRKNGVSTTPALSAKKC